MYMKKSKILKESEFKNILKKVLINNLNNSKFSINENRDDMNICDSQVNPSIKNQFLLLKNATNNFSLSLFSDWREDDILKVYLSLRSKELLDNLDKVIYCYFSKQDNGGNISGNYKGSSIQLLRLAFSNYELNKVKPVLVHLSNNLGQSQNIKSYFNMDNLTLSKNIT